MLAPEEAATITGHVLGGVCPFGLATPMPIYCDVQLRAFDEVVPGAGSTHTALRIAPDRVAALTAAQWVDICVSRRGAWWTRPMAASKQRRRGRALTRALRAHRFGNGSTQPTSRPCGKRALRGHGPRVAREDEGCGRQ